MYVAPESAMTSSIEAMGLQMVPICNENDNYVRLLLGAGKKMICDIPASTLASAPSQLWPFESLEAKGANGSSRELRRVRYKTCAHLCFWICPHDSMASGTESSRFRFCAPSYLSHRPTPARSQPPLPS